MILTGNEDLRVQRTVESIKKAFGDLICELDYEKIKVTELCARAKINKKTFYVYYPTLDDLLAEIQLEYSSAFIERVKDFKLPDDIEKVNREFFMFSVSQGLAYEKITCAGSYNYIRQKMMNNVIDSTWNQADKYRVLDTLHQHILHTFLNSLTVGMYIQWVEDGKKTPVEELIELSNKLLNKGISGIFE